MSARKSTLFYVSIVAVASMAMGMVLASRLDLSPPSAAAPAGAAPPMNSAPLVGPVDAQTFREIATIESAMVVNLRTKSLEPVRAANDPTSELFRPFFDDQGSRRRGPRERTAGAGTGFLIDRAGYILTNNHVIEDADDIEVGFFGSADDDYYPARIVGRDPLTDSALIRLTRVPSRDLTVARFGDSDRMRPGDWVMAIGNPFNLGHSISVGVISALGRGLDVVDGRRVNMLQTDAAINQGNSGGPMLNIRGEVVGINTAILTDRSHNLGIGFAVPTNVVREIIPELRQGRVVRGMIGVRIQPLPSRDYEEFGLGKQAGVIVSAVEPNGPASRAGLRRGDVIIEFGGHEVADDEALVNLVTRTKPGTAVPVKIVRERQRRTVAVTIEELKLGDDPQVEPAAAPGDATGFGVALIDLTPDVMRRLDVPRGTRGAVVAEVEAQSSADDARLDRGDILLEVNSEAVRDAADGKRKLQAVPAGRLARIVVYRDGQEVFVTMRKE